MPEDLEPRKFPWVKPKDKTVPEIYANYVAVSWTLFDVRFIAGQLIPDKPDGQEFSAEERAAVTFAWPEAKILRDVLTDLIARYEKTNGEIKPVKIPSNKPLDQI